MNDAEQHLLKFITQHISIRSQVSPKVLSASVNSDAVKINGYHISGHGISGTLYKLLFKQVAIMWLKALKFDAMVGRFTQWQEEHKIQSQQALVIEQMLSSFKGLQSPND